MTKTENIYESDPTIISYPGRITVSVRNTTGAWEIIDSTPLSVPLPECDRELDPSDVDASAHDLGGEIGQAVLVELRDADDVVIDSVETVLT